MAVDSAGGLVAAGAGAEALAASAADARGAAAPGVDGEYVRRATCDVLRAMCYVRRASCDGLRAPGYVLWCCERRR